MFYRNFLFFTLLIFSFLVLDSKGQNLKSNEIPTLTYSELMQNKENFPGKTVRVKAFHIYGFE